MIKKEWHFMDSPMTRKKIIKKLQQICDKLPKGDQRKKIRKMLLKLKLKK